MLQIEQIKPKEKKKISKINFLIHPGLNSDPDEFHCEASQYKIDNWSWKHLYLLERYIEKAKNMNPDEIMVAFLHTKEKAFRTDISKKRKLYVKTIDEIKKILGKRLIVISKKVDITRDPKSFEGVRKILEARGFSFDEDLARAAFGENFAHCVHEGAGNIDKSGIFRNKTEIERELSNRANNRERSLKTKKFDLADFNENKRR